MAGEEEFTPNRTFDEFQRPAKGVFFPQWQGLQVEINRRLSQYLQFQHKLKVAKHFTTSDYGVKFSDDTTSESYDKMLPVISVKMSQNGGMKACMNHCIGEFFRTKIGVMLKEQRIELREASCEVHYNKTYLSLASTTDKFTAQATKELTDNWGVGADLIQFKNGFKRRDNSILKLAASYRTRSTHLAVALGRERTYASMLARLNDHVHFGVEAQKTPNVSPIMRIGVLLNYPMADFTVKAILSSNADVGLYMEKQIPFFASSLHMTLSHNIRENLSAIGWGFVLS